MVNSSDCELLSSSSLHSSMSSLNNNNNNNNNIASTDCNFRRRTNNDGDHHHDQHRPNTGGSNKFSSSASISSSTSTPSSSSLTSSSPADYVGSVISTSTSGVDDNHHHRKHAKSFSRRIFLSFMLPSSKSSIWPCLTLFFFVLTVLSNIPSSSSSSQRKFGIFAILNNDIDDTDLGNVYYKNKELTTNNNNKNVIKATTTTITTPTSTSSSTTSSIEKGKSDNKKVQLRGTASGKSSFKAATTSPPPQPFSIPSKVVLLPGPHKSGSTTTQHFLYAHSKNDGGDGALANWVWPTPSDDELNSLNLRALHAFKNYAPLYGVLSQQVSFIKNPEYKDSDGNAVNESKIVDLYRTKIREAWSSSSSSPSSSKYNHQINNNIVFGSEEMDWLSSNQPFTDSMMDTTMKLLPFDDTERPLQLDEVEAVVLYRSQPRVSHLRSIWKEVDHNTRNSFQLFLKNRPDLFHMVDSLSIALKFLDRGMKTTIIDIHGVSASDRDISHTIACEVLHVDCTDDGYVRSLVSPDAAAAKDLTANHGRRLQQVEATAKNMSTSNAQQPRPKPSSASSSSSSSPWPVKNQKNPAKTTDAVATAAPTPEDTSKMNQKDDPAGGLGDLDETDLEKINHVIQQYDCGLRSALQVYIDRGMVRFLYPTNGDLFSDCPSSPTGTGGSIDIPRPPLSWLIESIQKIATSASNNKKKATIPDEPKISATAAAAAKDHV
jgi:hypothetical protein